MASAAVASKGPAMAGLLKKLLAEPASSGAPVACYALRPASLAAARRLFNTHASDDDDYTTSGESESEREYEDAAVGHRRRRARDFAVPSYFSQDVHDRFGAPTSLGGLLALLDDAASGGLSSAAPRRGFPVAKEDDDAVYLKVAMPGLGKEHVKVWAEQNSLVIKGKGDKETWGGDAVPKYSRRVELPADAFKMDKIKAEMKNGVLRVTVPKVKDEERKDVFQVTIE